MKRLYYATIQVPLDVCFVSDFNLNKVELQDMAAKQLGQEISTNKSIYRLKIKELVQKEDIPEAWKESLPWGDTGVFGKMRCEELLERINKLKIFE